MNYKLIVNEEESVTFGLIWRLNHLFLLCVSQLRQIIYHLKSVGGVGHAEAEFEIIRLDALPAEVVSLYHHEIRHWFLRDTEFNLQSNCMQS